jgi:hypothetical protein
MFVLRAEIVTIFEPKMVTISARNTKFGNFARLYFPSFTTFRNQILQWKLCKAIFSKLYNISQPNFAILLISYSCGV